MALILLNLIITCKVANIKMHIQLFFNTMLTFILGPCSISRPLPSLPFSFVEGLLCFLSKKLLKIKYGFEGSISNVDLGLF